MTCGYCGVRIIYPGKGRPATLCDECRPVERAFKILIKEIERGEAAAKLKGPIRAGKFRYNVGTELRQRYEDIYPESRGLRRGDE